MQYNMRNIYRAWSIMCKLLFELKEPRFNFVFDINIKLSFGADKFMFSSIFHHFSIVLSLFGMCILRILGLSRLEICRSFRALFGHVIILSGASLRKVVLSRFLLLTLGSSNGRRKNVALVFWCTNFLVCAQSVLHNEGSRTTFLYTTDLWLILA